MNSLDLYKLDSTQMTYQNCFTEVEMIGEGGFSKVYDVVNKVDQCHYAVKQVVLETSQEANLEVALYKVMREARYLARLAHPRIIRYFTSWVQKKSRSPSPSKFASKAEFLSLEKVVSQFGINISQIQGNNCCDNDDEPFTSYRELDENFIENDSFKDSDKDLDTPIRVTPQVSLSRGRNLISDQNRGVIELKRVDCSLKKFHSEGSRKNQKFETLVFYLQTELCRETLASYLNKRNEHLRVLKRSGDQQYEERLASYRRQAQLILEQILDGIEYIHCECQLVHRDLKPANIFMKAVDDIKIGDFGLVRRLRHILRDDQFSRIVSAKGLDGNDEATGDLDEWDHMGTAYYTSPEIRDARGQTFDQKQDIYSLGVIMFQLFHPMSTSMELMQKLGEARKGRLPLELSTAHPELAEIITRCLAKDPSDRPNLKEIKERLMERADLTSTLSNEDSLRESFRGYLEVQFEDDTERSQLFCCIDGTQMYLYRDEKAKKALHLYSIPECEVHLWKGELRLSHARLNNLVILLPETKFPVDELLQIGRKQSI